MLVKNLKRTYSRIRRRLDRRSEAILMLLGKQLSWQVASLPPNTDFRKVGFKVFSQWDEDGIIQYLISKLPIPSRTFIEFGVENFEESNTRFLLLNDHWQGMVLDCSHADIDYIRRDRLYWQYDLQARQAWITRDNINRLLADAGFGEDVGLLSIDIDGNDYWIWEAITCIRPRIVVIEYNSLFGLQPISIPYQESFQRTQAHYSNLYWGASLGAFCHLAKEKGYYLAGSNVWGHNAFFIRADVAGEFRNLELRQAYVSSKFRESRDAKGKLSFARGNDRLKLIEDLPVIQVITGETGKMKAFWTAPE